MIESADNRLLTLTAELINKGVTPDEAAKIAKEMTLARKPWYSPDEAALIVGIAAKSVRKGLRGFSFKGARKFGGQWRIPAEAILPKGVTNEPKAKQSRVVIGNGIDRCAPNGNSDSARSPTRI